jgi:hypothetical protein
LSDGLGAAHLRRRGRQSDANGVLVRVLRETRDEPHRGRRGFHPLLRGLVQLPIGAGQIIDAGLVRVLKGQRRVAHGLDGRADFLCESGLHPHAMQRALRFGVDDHGAAHKHGRVVMRHGIQDHLALGPVATGGETDQQPGGQRLMHGGPRARRDAAIGRQQRAVQIDRDHPVLRHASLIAAA